jgi:hypothetical protein
LDGCCISLNVRLRTYAQHMSIVITTTKKKSQKNIRSFIIRENQNNSNIRPIGRFNDFQSEFHPANSNNIWRATLKKISNQNQRKENRKFLIHIT